MKTWILVVAATILSVSSHGQGTVLFSTLVPGLVNAPVYGPDGVQGPGPGTHARLFLLAKTEGNQSLRPLDPITTFRDESVGYSRYVVVPPEPVVVQGVLPGQEATLIMRIWQGVKYETSPWRGESAPVTIVLGDEDTPAPLVGLQSFTLPLIQSSISFEDIRMEGENLRFKMRSIGFLQSYVIESSTNFQDWQPIITNAVSVLTFTIPHSRTNGSAKCFRSAAFL